MPKLDEKLVDKLCEASRKKVVERGILSRPVLADLDGRDGDEILVTALDGQLYAWRGDGSALPGFPVPFDLDHAGETLRAKSVSTPAVADLDGDGRPEVVFGTNLVRGERAAAFAVRPEGTAHPDGPFVPGSSVTGCAGRLAFRCR